MERDDNYQNRTYMTDASFRGSARGRFRGRRANSGWRPPFRGNFHRTDFRQQRNNASVNVDESRPAVSVACLSAWVQPIEQDWRRRLPANELNRDGYFDRSRGRGLVETTQSRSHHRRPAMRNYVRNEIPCGSHNMTGSVNAYEGMHVNSNNFDNSQRSFLKNENNFPEREGTQKERLTDELTSGTCDCVICFEHIRQSDRIWSCCNCYHVFHLNCIKKWAISSSEKQEEGWRCPGCQNVFHEKPTRYYCFCGKEENPEWNRSDSWKIPHSCGEQCLKLRRQKDCLHPCTLQCHPGPCPPCIVYVSRSCFCGRTIRQMRCDNDELFGCENTCDKTLSCDTHKCHKACHPDDGHLCDKKVLQLCFCRKNDREVQCTKESLYTKNYCCGELCGRLLKCGNHKCQLLCHSGDCPTCQLSPELAILCPCGKTKVTELDDANPRTICTDPLLTCTNICGKTLSCGPQDDKHACTSICHADLCPPCNLITQMKCNCSGQKLKIKCEDITADLIVKCRKRCNKLKTCGRHRCNQICCTDSLHKCDLICGQKLSCNLHKCDRLCHLGNCPPCQNTSFNELSCHCGNAIMYPPIPCGTQPPECQQPCQRVRNCEHPPQHKCHSDPECPPCTVLTSKWCYGGHELRSCIPCFQTEVCCGLPCNQPLPCGRHLCSKRCHSGSCALDGLSCSQPCPIPRLDCGHPCLLPCHDGFCPHSICQSKVTVTCRCGRKSGSMFCSENVSLYNRMAALQVSSDMLNFDEKLQRTRTLECDEECAMMERNRRLALALQIRNPDLTNKLRPPAYSDFLKDQAKKYPELVSLVYQHLTDLVQSAKDSKQKSRSFAFQPMKSDFRRVIHELAEFFGCETQSYDKEPKKNVVATAFKDKSWLPSASLLSVVEKESSGSHSRLAGRAPPPVPHCSSRRNVPSTSAGSQTKTKKSAIDYFDYTD